MKSCSKQKLADELGVSRQTFYRWLKRDQEVLQGMGVSIRAKIMPPPAVRYICEKYNMPHRTDLYFQVTFTTFVRLNVFLLW